MSLKLHLGCGMKKIHGFVNVDALAEVNPDSIQDVFTLPSVKDGSVDELYACHVLEHAKRGTYVDVLIRWKAVLSHGGKIKISVPDIEAVMKWYLVHGKVSEIAGFLWGGQRNEYDHHGVGWDFVALKHDLENVGFRDVKRYDWRTTDHAYVDDYSQAYLPHMDKENGMLMSLNMEATKP
jgi:hypothetical protein